MTADIHESLYVKDFSEKFIDLKVEWMNDEEMNRYQYYPNPATSERTLQWWNDNKENPKVKEFVLTGSENEVIGMGGFTDVHTIDSHACLHIMIEKTKHGHSYGTIFLRWLTNYAFSALNLHKVYLTVSTQNINAISLYEKNGYIREGLLREEKHKIIDGKSIFRDSYRYSILRKEWESKEWKSTEISYKIEKL